MAGGRPVGTLGTENMSKGRIITKLRKFCNAYEKAIKDKEPCEIKATDYLRALEMLIKLGGYYIEAKQLKPNEEEEVEFVV